MMKNILDLLRKPKNSSAELRDALSQLSVAEAEKLVETLEADRRKYLLDGSEKELEAIEAKLASANRDVERTYVAIEELKRRIAEAGTAEASAQLERTMAAARELAVNMVDLYVDAYRHLEALGVTVRQIVVSKREMNDANELATAAKRSDLLVISPSTFLAEIVGHPVHVIIDSNQNSFLTMSAPENLQQFSRVVEHAEVIKQKIKASTR
jgi:hypothetical protein